MLQQATVDFITKLGKNNNKTWFDKNRDAYQAAKEDFEQFVGQVKDELSKLEPALADQKPKEMVFRIFRDVRFAKDKTPYKDHFGAYMSRGGRKAPDGGFYLHVQPAKSFVAGGIWMPENPLLKKLRQEVDYNFKEFTDILKEPAFKKLFKKIEGEQLKSLPQGYTADNPAIDYLKMKSFIVSVPIDEKELLTKTAVAKVVKPFTAMKPFIDFLNRALD